jgi:beta-xylosidase
MKFLHCAFVWLVTATAAPAAEVMFTNPVLAGDYPDPSVIRVGKDYWATATSSEWGRSFRCCIRGIW